MDNRPSFDDIMLATASLFGDRSTCRRLHVGCVVAVENRIVTCGYNGPPAKQEHCSEECSAANELGCSRSIHAEINAIAFAAKRGISLQGGTFYVTHAPCINCASAILASGAIELVFMFKYKNDDGINFLIQNGVTVIQ